MQVAYASSCLNNHLFMCNICNLKASGALYL